MNGNKIFNKIDLVEGAGLGVCSVKIRDKYTYYVSITYTLEY